MPLPSYTVELLARNQLASNTIDLTFLLDAPFSFEAGQFISLLFEHEGEELKRSYSISSPPELFEAENKFQIAIGLVPGGAASYCFSNAQSGDTFQMRGPFGMLTLPDEAPERLIMVGTGTGMAPYHSMLPQLKQLANDGTKIHILMGARRRHDLFYQETFRSLADDYSGVIFETCLSREEAIHSDAHEKKGYVQDRFPDLNLCPDSDLVFLCGNPAMIDDSVAWLKEKGFGTRQVRREKYTFSR